MAYKTKDYKNVSNLRYPLDIDEYPATITFAVVENPSIMSPKKPGNVDDINKRNVPRQTHRSCTLYLPQALEFNDAANYSNAELGTLGALTEQALKSQAGVAGSIGKVAESVTNDIMRTGGGMIDAIMGRGVSPETVKMAITKIVAGNAEDGIAAGFKSGFRVSSNPNYRSLFNDVPIRTFNFDFNMIPKSETEAKAINDIIKFFRTELYPTKILQNKERSVSYGYNFPNTFRISTHYNGEPIGHLYLDCYLTAISTKYNSNAQAFVHDFKNPETSKPNFSDYSITMSFTETHALDRTHIQEGY